MAQQAVIISGEHLIYHFRPDMEPKWRVRSGDLLEIRPPGDTYSWIESEADVLHAIDIENVHNSHNACVGPIYVEGAEPGDTLMFEIHEIRVHTPVGRLMLIPGFGLLKEDYTEARSKLVPVRDGVVHFDRWRIPHRPMIGTIGVAPAEGNISTVYPHDGGGNMDCTDIAPGSRVYLPVAVPGALLAMGDTKPAMSDGEANGTGVSAPVAIHGRVEVIKQSIPRPIVETADEWMTIASAPTLEGACRQAALDLLALLERHAGLSTDDAYMLLGVVADLRICQVVNPLMTARMAISKEYLPDIFPPPTT